MAVAKTALGRALNEKQVNRGDLAKSMGVSQTTLSAMVNGHYAIPAPRAAQFAEASGLTAAEILADTRSSRHLKLRDVIADEGLSLADVARELSVHYQPFCAMVRGYIKTPPKIAAQLEERFGLPIDVLLAQSEPDADA